MNAVRSIVRGIDRISTTLGVVTSYLILVVIAVSAYEIVCRYFLGRPTIWAFELCQMLFGAYFFLMAAMALQRGDHVTMDIICSRLTRRQIAVLNCVTFCFVCIFCLVIMHEGWKFAYKSMSMWEKSTSAWRPYIWQYKMCIPVGAALLFLQACANVVKELHLALTGYHLLPEAQTAEDTENSAAQTAQHWGLVKALLLILGAVCLLTWLYLGDFGLFQTSMGATTILMFVFLITLLCTGLPIFFSIGSVAIVFSAALWGTGGLAMMVYPTYGLMNTFLLAAVPLFILMGLILHKSGIADEMFDVLYKWAGARPGGLGAGTVFVCAIFACMVGVSGAATVAMGLIALPAMLKRGYSKHLACGTIMAGGALGLLIPPSVPFLVYAFLARQPAGALFASGMMPGLMLAAMYMAYILIVAKLNPRLAPPIPEEDRVDLKAKILALRGLVLPLGIVAFVIYCIINGICTIGEASVIGSLGAMLAAAVRGKLNWPMLKDALLQSANVTAMVMWIALAAVCFGSIYTGLGASQLVYDCLTGLGLGPWGIVIFMQLSIFVLGCFLDDTAIMFLTIPLYLPIIRKLGFDPIWFGALFVVNIQMAFLTPPYGLNLFYLKGVAPKEITMMDLYRSVVPFILLQATGLALVMLFPQIALWLPQVLNIR